jgi:cell division protease FtsH
LLEKEVLFQSDVEALIGKRPFDEKKVLSDDDEEEFKPGDNGEISAGVPPYDSDITNKSLPTPSPKK